MAEANQLRSQLDVEKYGPLAKADAVSKQDFDNATQTNLANQAQVQSAKAAIAAAKAQIQASQAAVETATINLNFTRITSPVDGVAGVAQAQVGDLVSTSSGVLTTVSTLDPIRDYFTVSEQEYLALRKLFLGPDAGSWQLQLILADGTTYPHEGRFYFADRAVNQNTAAIQLAALFANPGNALRPGQYGTVRAILIVEFAKEQYEEDKPLMEAALEGARLRLRPIMMTSFAVILGCVPLWTASGAGSVARQIMGTTVIGGMTAASVLGIFCVPAVFFLVERWSAAARERLVALSEHPVIAEGEKNA